MTDSTPEEKLLNLIKKDQSKTKIGKDLRIFTKVNIILFGIIGIMAIIFLADVFIFKDNSSEETALDIQAKMPQAQPQLSTNEKEAEIPAQNMPEKEIAVKKISKEEILGNLSLLGIITGDNNQAVIEDKTLKKTFFLYKGDSIGELKVYEIKNSVVILDYKGEKIELII